MTHTDPTAAGLLAGVLARPECDTARLVYADRLTEIAEPPRECPRCVGWSLRADMQISGSWPCPTCQGTGTVSDGLAERAELIRVQVELARHTHGWKPENLLCVDMFLDPQNDERQAWKHELWRLQARERDLLTDARRREWFGIPCPECDGTGRDRGDVYDRGMVGVCALCTGTGLAPVGVRRGFVESVRCRMGDVLREGYEPCPDCEQMVRDRRGRPGGAAQPRCGKCDGGARRVWQLTSWARGVLKAHPVTRWEILDREPWDGYRGLYGWWCQTSVTTGRSGITLPRIALDELSDDPRRDDGAISLRHTKGAQLGGCVLFAGDPEARDALARAVGRVARRLAGLAEG